MIRQVGLLPEAEENSAASQKFSFFSSPALFIKSLLDFLHLAKAVTLMIWVRLLFKSTLLC